MRGYRDTGTDRCLRGNGGLWLSNQNSRTREEGRDREELKKKGSREREIVR